MKKQLRNNIRNIKDIPLSNNLSKVKLTQKEFNSFLEENLFSQKHEWYFYDKKTNKLK